MERQNSYGKFDMLIALLNQQELFRFRPYIVQFIYKTNARNRKTAIFFQI